MDADDEDFFVVAAIENADAAALWNAFVSAPQVVVIELLVAGRFERKNLAALRIDAGHDVLDDAVLAGGVERLKNQKDGPAVLRVELFLEAAEEANAIFEHVLGLRFVF